MIDASLQRLRAELRTEQAAAIAELRAELLDALAELDRRLTGVHEHALRSLTATLSGKDANHG